MYKKFTCSTCKTSVLEEQPSCNTDCCENGQIAKISTVFKNVLSSMSSKAVKSRYNVAPNSWGRITALYLTLHHQHFYHPCFNLHRHSVIFYLSYMTKPSLPLEHQASFANNIVSLCLNLSTPAILRSLIFNIPNIISGNSFLWFCTHVQKCRKIYFIFPKLCVCVSLWNHRSNHFLIISKRNDVFPIFETVTTVFSNNVVRIS